MLGYQSKNNYYRDAGQVPLGNIYIVRTVLITIKQPENISKNSPQSDDYKGFWQSSWSVKCALNKKKVNDKMIHHVVGRNPFIVNFNLLCSQLFQTVSCSKHLDNLTKHGGLFTTCLIVWPLVVKIFYVFVAISPDLSYYITLGKMTKTRTDTKQDTFRLQFRPRIYWKVSISLALGGAGTTLVVGGDRALHAATTTKPLNKQRYWCTLESTRIIN